MKAEGFESSLKLPDKVLTFVRDHPLMENSVTAAPLLVRKGLRYTKLAVTHTGSGEERRGAVLHLGTGEEREEERGKYTDAAILNDPSLSTGSRPPS